MASEASHRKVVKVQSTLVWAFLGLCLIQMACNKKSEVQDSIPLENRGYAVSFISGTVEFSDSPAGPWAPLSKGDTLHGGQCLRTGYESSALLKGNFGDQVFLMELCRVVLDPVFLREFAGAGEKVRGVEVLSGKTWLSVAKGHGTFLGKTPGALARVKGTRFSLAYNEVTKSTQVVLEDGAVAVGSAQVGSTSLDLVPGETAEIVADKPSKAQKAEPSDLTVPSIFKLSGPAPDSLGTEYSAPNTAIEEGTNSMESSTSGSGPKSLLQTPTHDLDKVESTLETENSGVTEGPKALESHALAKTQILDAHKDSVQSRHDSHDSVIEKSYQAIAAEKLKREGSIKAKLEKSGSPEREKGAFDELDAETEP
jgi:hypothetical protein